ncbi:MAG TPA: tripartite tricarboxylate transporter substrate binding protein [Burkholderiales bacterium]|jgi:tripartite-type tricarboxylate transporter receptor subunit TctC|nr:tripartite tricarboxylate transporter substrate binding protein [Burkholderiales bacterium]
MRLLALLLFFVSLCARADYPERVVRIINTFPAGGSGDAVLRVVTDKLSAALGQPFVSETRTGAGGSIGTEFVAKAPPDGYTLVLGTASTFGTNSATMSKLAYDPVRDFTPVVMIATTPYLLLAHPSVPAKTTAEFVAYVKANPNKLNYGSFGNGSSNQLAYELLKQVTGMEIVHVPYKGGAPLITALLAGEVQSSFDVYATALPHIKSGRFRLLGVASAKRFSLLPETPTLAEQGYPVEGGTFFALLGPAKMPHAAVETLNREVNRALQLPDVRERLTSLGTEIAGGPPEALAATVKREVEKWAKVVKDRGLRFE